MERINENRIIIVLRVRVILSIGKTSGFYAQKVRQYRLRGDQFAAASALGLKQWDLSIHDFRE